MLYTIAILVLTHAAAFIAGALFFRRNREKIENVKKAVE